MNMNNVFFTEFRWVVFWISGFNYFFKFIKRLTFFIFSLNIIPNF